ncbi:MAG: tetratricopeptide repeat protein [Myxococcales bacterium]|nr:tetratricopeptide repeat protein [Myxococcales bacterium]
MEPTALVALFGGTALAALLALFLVLSRKGRSEDEARAYLAGFTYVLSDDPDAAIAELSKAAQLNRQTLETYFALGALFIRKGELERAIRLHQNILLRPGLSLDVRRRAQLALALDYKRAGLWDKAAEAFEKLLSEEPEHLEALLRYRQVLEQTRSFERAIALQTRLVSLLGKGDGVLAHLLAELSRSRLPGDPKDAERLARRAVGLDSSCADAQLALGEALVALGRAFEAAAPICRAVELEPELAPTSLRLLSSALESAGAVERFLEGQIGSRGEEGPAFELALALHLKAQGQVTRALERLRSLVDRLPRFSEARRELGALLLSEDRSEELKADYEEILGALGEPAMGFYCTSCDQRLPNLVFRCPACEEWRTVRRELGAARSREPAESRADRNLTR